MQNPKEFDIKNYYRRIRKCDYTIEGDHGRESSYVDSEYYDIDGSLKIYVNVCIRIHFIYFYEAFLYILYRKFLAL